MTQPRNQQIVARQVERIVRRLTGLSTLPAVAANLLNQLSDGAFDPAGVAETIQSDPALTAKILTLARQEQVAFTAEPTVSEAVAKLDPALLRQAVISAKVFEMFDWRQDPDADRVLPRRQMALHSLAVACCAQQLAEWVLPPDQRQSAYLAGLLHDIGKCALDEVMPKSFERMVEEAAGSGSSLLDIEQKHLGLDHTVLGKRLAQKWQLPEAVVSGIWLHHCDALALSADLPGVQIARIVALADRMARRADIGKSGSYDMPEQLDEIAVLLPLTPAQLESVSQNLPQRVHEKSAVLGLDTAPADTGYYAMIRQTAAKLAQDNRTLTTVSGDAAHLTTQVALIEEFLGGMDENATALDLAQHFAVGWKKHQQTGMTGVYVMPDETEPYAEAAIVNRQGIIELKSLSMPEEIPAIPQTFRTAKTVVPLAEGAKWLVEQFGGDFNPDMMYMAPLRVGDKDLGVLFFEVFSKTDGLLDTKRLTACQVAAAAIAMAQAGQKHLELAERFVGLMNTLRQTRTELARRQSLDGLAEMAAGAAHELNNPLAVISGRAQFLLDDEKDKKKKRMLRQIQLRTEDIYAIVNDLMAFARPNDPDKRSVPLGELLDAAAELARKTVGRKSIDTDIAIADDVPTVFVDAEQVTQALGHIMTNALLAYKKNAKASVRIKCTPAAENGVAVRISDTGCGMDVETLAKATQPFFSFRPAGRRSGMGLAIAQRLLMLNGGTLKLTSRPDKGTTVTVTLPKS